MSGFSDYDPWKTRSPHDTGVGDAEVCDRCGGFLERNWPPGGWHCDRCDEENEYREQQLDEQIAQSEGAHQ